MLMNDLAIERDDTDVTATAIGNVTKVGAKVLMSEVTLEDLIKRSNLQPMLNLRRMIIDVDVDNGDINIEGAWLFSERLMGSVGEDTTDRELILLAAGQYTEKDRRIIPVIHTCAALENDWSMIKAIKFDGDGSVEHGIQLDERELCSCFAAMSNSIRNGSVINKNAG